MKGLKPSDFCIRPWNCIHQKSESETIALNIMKILKRTSNTFRPIEWKEYKEERQKDGNFSEREKEYFDNVVNFCVAEENAYLFSKTWEDLSKGLDNK